MIDDEGEEYKVKVRRCRETGNVVEESWYHLNGERGRAGAPARLVWDAHTFNLIVEEYWTAGGLESPLSGRIPAYTAFDPITGQPVCCVWMRYNRKHRSADLPAVEFFRDGKPIRQEYWIDGQLNRISGPAIVNLDPTTGRIISTSNAFEEKLQTIPRGYLPPVPPR